MTRFLGPIALLPLTACATVTTALGGTLTVDDAELAGLTPEQKADIAPAEAAEADAIQELTSRRHAAANAEREVAIATWAVRQAEAGLEIARLRFDQAQLTKNADAMLPARAARSAATDALHVAEAELAFREAARRYHDALVEEAEAARDVATAGLQMKRLEALLDSKGELTPEDADRRASFEMQLSNRKAALVEETAAVTKAKKAMDEAHTTWQAEQSTRPAPSDATAGPDPKPPEATEGGGTE